MRKDPSSPETTSRRQFTKSVVTAAVAVPIVASMVGCRSEGGAGNISTVHPSPSPTGHRKEECWPTGGTIEDHIPPMGFDGGGGSLLIDSVGELSKKGRYYEEDSPSPSGKLGSIKEVRIITELADYPYVTATRYWPLPEECELWLWNQYLKQSPGTHECLYDPIDFANKPPDITIVGGHMADTRPFRMTFPENLKPKEKTYKCGRPHRYKQADKSGPKGHFRVCQWRIVDKGKNQLFGDNVQSAGIPEHFRFYVLFEHYDPDAEKSKAGAV